MSVVINIFLALPLWVRIALVMFLMIVVFWKVFGKVVLRIFSVAPFLVEKAFCGVYLLVDIPVSYLHKKFGSGFGTLDNSLSAGGGKIDDILKMWYGAWHSPKEVRMSRQLLIYILCMGVVLGPALFKLDEKWRMGENLYITGETSVINWFKQRGIYDAADVLNVGEEIIEKKSGLEETVFVVSGVNNSLLVRDIPDTENCMVLDRLKNDDEVILTGDMTFAETENGHIEPWVRVITENGIEGWSRLFYLHPKEYQGIEFYLQDHEE